MGPVVYVMAILGCGEADAACQPVATVPARYESQAACNDAAEDVLARQDDILFPVVVAQCGEEGAMIAEGLTADEVALPEAEQRKTRRAHTGKPERARG